MKPTITLFTTDHEYFLLAVLWVAALMAIRYSDRITGPSPGHLQ